MSNFIYVFYCEHFLIFFLFFPSTFVMSILWFTMNCQPWCSIFNWASKASHTVTLVQIGRSYVMSKLKDYPRFQAVAIAIQRSGFKVWRISFISYFYFLHIIFLSLTLSNTLLFTVDCSTAQTCSLPPI